MAKVEVDEKEYKALVEAAKRLEALETIGVDNWEGYDEIDITYKIEGKYIIFNSNALYLGGAPWVIKSYTQKHITLIQNEASPDKEKVAIIELDRID